ncbi:MAG: hypothetical protein IPK19_18925 [Chloroflexi bacterium]|nr:hypothetical protein [Chloroflexota bacterium]
MGIAGVLSTLSLVGFLAFLGGIALVVLSASQGRPVRAGITLAIVGLIVGALFAIVGQGILIVQPQEVAVVFNSLTGNVEEDPRRSGTSIIIPGVQEYTLYRIDQQEYTMSGTTAEGARTGDDAVRARTRDGQEVGLDITIIFAVNPLDADMVHIRWRDRYTEDFVRPTARSFVRDVISGYAAEEIYGSGRSTGDVDPGSAGDPYGGRRSNP